jgi:hypothetical protein
MGFRQARGPTSTRLVASAPARGFSLAWHTCQTAYRPCQIVSNRCGALAALRHSVTFTQPDCFPFAHTHTFIKAMVILNQCRCVITITQCNPLALMVALVP